MKKKLIVTSVALLVASGCAMTADQERGATFGAVTGTAIGTNIGHHNNHSSILGGGVVGAVVGGALGYMITQEGATEAPDHLSEPEQH